MIRILPFASGSKGNCIYVETGGHKILVDIGISFRMLCSELHSNGLEPDEIEAVLITHTHSDHIKGLETWRKKNDAPVFASGATLQNLCLPPDGELPWYSPREILPGLHATAFRTSHDCIGSAGFLLRTEASSLGISTDLGVMTPEIPEMLAGAQCIIIESNHDEEMLFSGPYPYSLKKRIFSENGHLSNSSCAEALKIFYAKGTKNFLLAHLSRENNTPALAMESACAALSGTDAKITVLLDRGNGEIII